MRLTTDISQYHKLEIDGVIKSLLMLNMLLFKQYHYAMLRALSYIFTGICGRSNQRTESHWKKSRPTQDRKDVPAASSPLSSAPRRYASRSSAFFFAELAAPSFIFTPFSPGYGGGGLKSTTVSPCWDISFISSALARATCFSNELASALEYSKPKDDE